MLETNWVKFFTHPLFFWCHSKPPPQQAPGTADLASSFPWDGEHIPAPQQLCWHPRDSIPSTAALPALPVGQHVPPESSSGAVLQWLRYGLGKGKRKEEIVPPSPADMRTKYKHPLISNTLQIPGSCSFDGHFI